MECYSAMKRNGLPVDSHSINESQNNHAMWKQDKSSVGMHLYKILENAKKPLVTERVRSVIAWGQWGMGGGAGDRVPQVGVEGGITKGQEEILWLTIDSFSLLWWTLYEWFHISKLISLH